MNILEVLSIKIPRTPFGQGYEVPLKDILLSNQMLEQGCPVQDETECPPLFQTRLISRDVLSEIVEAWSRLEDGVPLKPFKTEKRAGTTGWKKKNVGREPDATC